MLTADLSELETELPHPSAWHFLGLHLLNTLSHGEGWSPLKLPDGSHANLSPVTSGSHSGSPATPPHDPAFPETPGNSLTHSPPPRSSSL